MLLFPSVAQTQQSGMPATQVSTTAHFAFHSDVATNLHDALYHASRARLAQTPELFRAPSEEKVCFDALPAPERAGWNAAVDFYASTLAPGSYLAQAMMSARLDLATIARLQDWTNADDRRMIEVMRGIRAAATPAYQRCRWEAQDVANRLWIATVAPLVAAHESTIAARLSQVYRTTLSGFPYRVDVVERFMDNINANAINLNPPGLHILIARASADSQGIRALDSLFHEASHFLTGGGKPVPVAVATAVKGLRASVRADFVHAVQFYLSGAVVREALIRAGQPGYQPIMPAGFPAPLVEALGDGFESYVAGARSLDQAAADFVQALDRRVAARSR